jgi:gluconokinase
VIADRLEHRPNHYMPPSLLTSQLETLETLDPDEPGATIAAHRPPPEIVADILTLVRQTDGKPEAGAAAARMA